MTTDERHSQNQVIMIVKKKLLKNKNYVSDLIGLWVFISHREELRNNQENLKKLIIKYLKKTIPKWHSISNKQTSMQERQ